jgi:hypothetical protein
MNCRTRQALSRVLMLVIPVLVVGCGRECCVDDFGVSGYAHVQGTVTRSTGAAFVGGTVTYSCGPDSPGMFGGVATTDNIGKYFLDINAPGPVLIPESGMLRCRISAHADATPFVSVEQSVPFSAQRVNRPITIIDLAEPAP